uniref:Aa_trans domain-containing protein n=1 Tax=Macrostomum lignano TaxID=282301 RepID=A0A1I8FDY1_9PLAT
SPWLDWNVFSETTGWHLSRLRELLCNWLQTTAAQMKLLDDEYPDSTARSHSEPEDLLSLGFRGNWMSTLACEVLHWAIVNCLIDACTAGRAERAEGRSRCWTTVRAPPNQAGGLHVLGPTNRLIDDFLDPLLTSTVRDIGCRLQERSREHAGNIPAALHSFARRDTTLLRRLPLRKLRSGLEGADVAGAHPDGAVRQPDRRAGIAPVQLPHREFDASQLVVRSCRSRAERHPAGRLGITVAEQPSVQELRGRCRTGGDEAGPHRVPERPASDFELDIPESLTVTTPAPRGAVAGIRGGRGGELILLGLPDHPASRCIIANKLSATRAFGLATVISSALNMLLPLAMSASYGFTILIRFLQGLAEVRIGTRAAPIPPVSEFGAIGAPPHELSQLANIAFCGSNVGSCDTPWKSIFTSLPVLAVIVMEIAHGWGILPAHCGSPPSFFCDVFQFDLTQVSGFVSAMPHLLTSVIVPIGGCTARLPQQWALQLR